MSRQSTVWVYSPEAPSTGVRLSDRKSLAAAMSDAVGAFLRGDALPFDAVQRAVIEAPGGHTFTLTHERREPDAAADEAPAAAASLPADEPAPDYSNGDAPADPRVAVSRVTVGRNAYEVTTHAEMVPVIHKLADTGRERLPYRGKLWQRVWKAYNENA